MGSHVLYWKQLCVRYICSGGGHMMKENSYNYGRDKKDTRLFANIYVGWLVIKKEVVWWRAISSTLRIF